MVENEFRTIDRYETIDLLGRGGMGSVYLARDPLIDRHVAVKVLDAAFDSSARERFTREARASGRLHHPNIVTIFDVGEHQGRPFIAMEYVPGQTLAALIRQGRLDPAEKLRLIADACVGLAHAHRAGIIHLDVKPENLVRHETGVLKILDFGIARVLVADATRTHHVMGTWRYMAPEQANGQTIDRRSDVFALGCVLYELIAGVPAFKGTLEELLSRVTKPTEVPPLSKLVPGVHPELVRITQRAMANDPDHRYDDLEVLKRELDELRRQLISVPQETARLVLELSAADTTSSPGFEATTRVAETDRSTGALRIPDRRRHAALAALVIGLVAVSAGVLFRVDPSRPPTDTQLPEQVSTTPPLPAGTPTAVVVAPPSQPANENRAAAASGGGASDLEGQVWRLIAQGDGEAALRLLREQPGRLSKPVVNELVRAARTSVNQSRLNAEQKGTLPGSLQAAGAESSASTIDERPLAPVKPLASTALSDPPVASPGDARPPDGRARPAETAADALAPEEAIRTLLKAYEAAYDERDAAALQRIVPGLSAEQLGAVTRTFAEAVSYDVEVQVVATNISGSTATATCLVTHAFVPKIGSASRNPPLETRFYLRQASDGWVIERIERSAKP